MTSNNFLIQLNNFTYQYPHTANNALKSINLSLKKGSFVGFAGPTGAGKTTLIKSINGIVPHFEGGTFSGEVLLNGKAADTMSTAEIGRSVGTVLDDPEAQIICLDVEQELVFGMENYGVPPAEMEQRMQKALASVGIAHLLGRSTASLSGGQKQRLAIAAALAMLPEVLVLDEPTSELDPLGSEEVFRVLKQLHQEQGMTILVTEQKTDLLARYCDQLVILREGEMVLSGTPREVFQHQDIFELGVALPEVTELARRYYPQAEPPITLDEGVQFCRNVILSFGG